MKKIRIYGDNIVECKRILDMLEKNNISPLYFSVEFENQSSLLATAKTLNNDVKIEMFPGFGKSAKKRWNESIMDQFTKSLDLLDETPDAILTKVNGDEETIICAIEFCSALQAGNQAWQRSGRAYSIGKAGIPYIYIIDFTRYELNNQTRRKKNLRFPNICVPISFASYSKRKDNLVIEACFRSEEFDKNNVRFKSIDFSGIFSETDVSNYITSLIFGFETKTIEEKLIEKNLNFIKFLAKDKSLTSITKSQIDLIDYDNMVQSISSLCNFHAKKTIEKKSTESSKLLELNDYIGKVSKGVFTNDLPFMLIPKEKMTDLVNKLESLYDIAPDLSLSLRGLDGLVVVLLKGFKPRGDDDRPDRGVLPLIRMIFGENTPILSIVYGPIVSSNLKMLKTSKAKLAENNGFWKTIFFLSDFLLVDSPIIGKNYIEISHECFLTRAHDLTPPKCFLKSFKKLDVTPASFREDDVDGLIFKAFTYNEKGFFIGLCNPPGGDWSGFSLLEDGKEYRWLSLPRVSSGGNKRPDHVIQFLNEKILFLIESKDSPHDLEKDIGPRLSEYIKWLMRFAPSVQKEKGNWLECSKIISDQAYVFFTAGAFIGRQSDDQTQIMRNSKVDFVFNFFPKEGKWGLEVSYFGSIQLEKIAHIIKSVFDKEKIIVTTILKPLESS